jgi:S-adenosylmethionine:tRNA ribosyltransferase-isomerase
MLQNFACACNVFLVSARGFACCSPRARREPTQREAVTHQVEVFGDWQGANRGTRGACASQSDTRFAPICAKIEKAMTAQLTDYDFILPRELIAQRPLEHREDSRMMVLHRAEQAIEHRQFRELKAFLRAGDLLVLNDTRVLPARRFSDDGDIEFLFLERLGPKRWKCLVKPGRKMRIGASAKIQGVTLRVKEITDDGERIVALNQDVDLYVGGSMPLPPYINRLSDQKDTARYQTVFAHAAGAIAAPTAGLHFTPEILSDVQHTFVTLHVGTGTFLPVRSENITEHRMHAERFSLSPEAATEINTAQRVIAVGTTVVRVLETAALQTRLLKAVKSNKRQIEPQSGKTDLFIYPPFAFRVVDALLTNFHLSRSTLLMLVSAFAGREFLLRAYEEAIRERYRFYSYGDCMLIL